MKPEEVVEQAIRKLIADCAATGEPCILCGGKPDGVGVWIPTSKWSQRLGALPGKTRIMAYPICCKHKLNESTEKQIDDKIFEKLNQLGSPRPNFSN